MKDEVIWDEVMKRMKRAISLCTNGQRWHSRRGAQPEQGQETGSRAKLGLRREVHSNRIAESKFETEAGSDRRD